MRKLAVVLVAIFLVLHGIAHLVGTVQGLRLGSFTGVVFAVLAAAGAAGFAVAALALVVRWRSWPPFLVGITLYSLALTVYAWNAAWRGAVINLAILAAMALRTAMLRPRYC